LFFPGDLALAVRKTRALAMSPEQRCTTTTRWWLDFQSVKAETYVVILDVDAVLTQNSVFIITGCGKRGWVDVSALVKIDESYASTL
jgi:hypothetical protein